MAVSQLDRDGVSEAKGRNSDPGAAFSFMQSMDERYQAVSGLHARRDYSIFYSQILPCRVMVLGWNPGGDPRTWSETELASTSYYENGEHEYVDCHYPLAVAMRTFLVEALALRSDDEIRTIPKANLIFRRSRGQDSLGIRDGEALTEAKPFVEQIINRVQPTAIILEGTKTLKAFERHYCGAVEPCVDGERIMTPNGKVPASIYQFDKATIRCLGRSALLVGLGHPSRYAARAEWSTVIERSKRALLVMRSESKCSTSKASRLHDT